MRNFIIFTHLIAFITLAIACQTSRPMLSEGISQGIAGTVLWYEGDLMPGIDREPVEGQPVQKEIHIYEATHLDQTEVRDGVFYNNLKTRLINKVLTDETGRFTVALEPGTYSVFVKEPGGLFANIYDEGGHINAVTIMPNELVRMRIRIDYMAAY
jgi:hypothetical protein